MLSLLLQEIYLQMSKMDKDEENRLHYINEHLPYEWSMLQYTFEQLRCESNQMQYNMLYAAFCVFARNLDSFLVNKDKKIQAAKFVKNYKADVQKIKSIKNRVHDQVFHTHDGRPIQKSPKKVQLEEVEKYYKWIVKNFNQFLEELPQNYKENWADNLNNVSGKCSYTVIPTQPTTTNAIQFVSSDNVTDGSK